MLVFLQIKTKLQKKNLLLILSGLSKLKIGMSLNHMYVNYF